LAHRFQQLLARHVTRLTNGAFSEFHRMIQCVSEKNVSFSVVAAIAINEDLDSFTELKILHHGNNTMASGT
jgi:hypothetical protein